MQNRLGRGLIALATLGFLFMAGLMFWVFSQHGTWGLYNWNYDYRALFNYLWALTFSIPAALLLTYGLRHRTSRRWFTVLKVFVAVLSLGGVAVSLYAGVYGIVIPARALLPSYEPVLLVEPAVGRGGIPDLYVHFNTDTPTTLQLWWGTASTPTVLSETVPVKEHFFRLADLMPGQDYFYRIGQEPIRWFRTPPLSESATLAVFAVGGDAHYGNEQSDPTERLLLLTTISKDPDINYFFMNGDAVELGMENPNWAEFFADFNNNLSKPTAYVLGNHDTLIGGLYHVKNYLYPEQVRIDYGNPLYHRIDVGSVHFLVLDVLWGTEEFSSAQKQWLEDQMKAIPKTDWVIVLSHCFYYASGNLETGRIWADHEGTTKEIAPLFEQYGIDLVISGHNHQMELLKKNGVTYAIASPVGGTLDRVRSIVSPYSLWYSNSARGFLKVTLFRDKATLEFKDFDGKTLNTFVINQNK